VTNVAFIFETSPNTKSKEKNVGGTQHIISPPFEKMGTRTSYPHQLALMNLCASAVYTKFLTTLRVAYSQERLALE